MRRVEAATALVSGSCYLVSKTNNSDPWQDCTSCTLEVRSWSLRGRTLWWHQGDVARRRRLHLAIRSWRKLCPCIIRACPRAGTASQESSQSQISEAEAKWIRGKAEEIWFVLIIDGIPGIQRQAEISRAEAGEHRSRVCRSASIFAVRRCACCRRWRCGSAV